MKRWYALWRKSFTRDAPQPANGIGTAISRVCSNTPPRKWDAIRKAGEAACIRTTLSFRNLTSWRTWPVSSAHVWTPGLSLRLRNAQAVETRRTGGMGWLGDRYERAACGHVGEGCPIDARRIPDVWTPLQFVFLPRFRVPTELHAAVRQDHRNLQPRRRRGPGTAGFRHDSKEPMRVGQVQAVGRS